MSHTRNSTSRYDITGLQRRTIAHVLDDPWYLDDHVLYCVVLAFLSVDSGLEAQRWIVWVRYLVAGDYAWSHGSRVVHSLSLGPVDVALEYPEVYILWEALISCADINHNRVACDVLIRLLLRDVFAFFANDNSQLALVIHLIGCLYLDQRVPWTNHEARRLLENIRHIQFEALEAVDLLLPCLWILDALSGVVIVVDRNTV